MGYVFNSIVFILTVCTLALLMMCGAIIQQKITIKDCERYEYFYVEDTKYNCTIEKKE